MPERHFGFGEVAGVAPLAYTQVDFSPGKNAVGIRIEPSKPSVLAGNARKPWND
jgi:hypothetical protein